jgi:hypothetical protein
VFGRFALRVAASAALLLPVVSASASAQAAAPPGARAALSRDDIAALARAFIAISKAQDSTNALRTQSRNKTRAAQQQIQEQFIAQRAEILHHAGLTDDEYRRRTFVIASDNDARKAFDSVVAAVTGAPLPGQLAAGGGRGAPVAVPAGPAGAHIGHVINMFSDTPDNMGLLPTAQAEARIAAQHATLAARDPANLVSMQTHAGHVIHALDPTVVTMGPGRGYGVKRAATGVASHIELAGRAAGATQNIQNHSVHIATSARNTVERVDQIVALAKQVQSATSAADAAKLVTQIVSLTDELMKGTDANADGRITWEKGEGGLQQAEEHLRAMLAAEMVWMV